MYLLSKGNECLYEAQEKGTRVSDSGPLHYGSPGVGFNEPPEIIDGFQIHQGVRRNTSYIEIGRQPQRCALTVATHRNPLKQALEYQAPLDTGEAHSQTELARLCRTHPLTV